METLKFDTSETVLQILLSIVPDRMSDHTTYYTRDPLCAVAVFDPVTNLTAIKWHSHAEDGVPIHNFTVKTYRGKFEIVTP